MSESYFKHYKKALLAKISNWLILTNFAKHLIQAVRNKGYCMSAHVLLNLLKRFEKEIKCEAWSALYIYLFRGDFNKINNTGARMLDFIYHMTL